MSVSVETKVFRHSVLIQVLNGGLLYASVWCVGVDAVMPSERTTTIGQTQPQKRSYLFSYPLLANIFI